MYKKKLLHQICDKGNPMRSSGKIGNILCDKNQLKLKSVQKTKQQTIRSSQKRHLSDEIKTLERKRSLKKSNGLLRVGDQLNQLTLEEGIKHPLLIPKHSILSKLLIMWCHKKVIHSGRGVTTNQIRSSGFSIVNCNAAVRSFSTICVTYRRLRGSFQLQKMALLSKDSIYEELTFTYCGVGLLVHLL